MSQADLDYAVEWTRSFGELFMMWVFLIVMSGLVLALVSVLGIMLYSAIKDDES